MSQPPPEPQGSDRPSAPGAWPGGGFGVAPPQPAQQPYPPSYQGISPPGGYQSFPSPGAYPAYPGYPAGAPTTTASFPGSTATLLAVSLVSVVLVGIVGIPSAVIAALAWRMHRANPVAARKRTTTGWIVYAVNFVLGIIVLIPFYVWALGRQ